MFLVARFMFVAHVMFLAARGHVWLSSLAAHTGMFGWRQWLWEGKLKRTIECHDDNSSIID